MKRLIILLNIIWIMSSCVSATPVSLHTRKPVTVVTVSPEKKHPKKSGRKKVRTIVIGSRVKTLPSRQVVIYYKNLPFIYAEGIFYRKLPSAEYEVIRPEVGMIVPQLPEYNVEKVRLQGETLFLFDGTLYKQVPTSQGVQYKVTGFID